MHGFNSRLTLLLGAGLILAACAAGPSGDANQTLVTKLSGIWSLDCKGAPGLGFNDLFLYRNGQWESGLVVGVPEVSLDPASQMRPMNIWAEGDFVHVQFKSQPGPGYVYRMIGPDKMRLWETPDDSIKNGSGDRNDPAGHPTPEVTRCRAI